MKLKEAIEIYQREKGAPSNAYDWYRRSAKDNGEVYIGNISIDAVKIGNQWYIDDRAFKEAIKSHQKRLELRKKNTEDYSKGIYHGVAGQIIEIEGGGYKNYEGFIFAWSNYLIARERSDGRWYCRQCSSMVKEEHNKKCTINSDWHNCTGECTLSKVYCPKCKTEVNFCPNSKSFTLSIELGKKKLEDNR